MDRQPSSFRPSQRTSAFAADGLSLSQIIMILHRRLGVFLSVLIVITVVGVAFSFLVTPVYMATSLIKLDPNQHKPLSANTQSSAFSDQTFVDTEVSVMRSPEVAQRVVRDLGLADNPMYAPRTGMLHSLLGGARPAPTPATRQSLIAKQLSRHFKVEREGATNLVDLSYLSTNPAQAALIANAFARSYLEVSVGAEVDTASQQASWLDSRVQALSAEVQRADADLAHYKAAAGIVSGGANGTITDQQIAPISTELATAESEAAAAHAKLTVTRAQIQKGRMDSIPDAQDSPTISTLRLQRAEALNNQAKLNARYGPKFPKSIEAQRQIDEFSRQISAEEKRIYNGLESSESSAEARAVSLRGDLGTLRNQQAANTQASVQASRLQQIADAATAAYNEALTEDQRAHQQEHLTEIDAHLISPAARPLTPAFPNIPLFVALSVFVGLISAASAVFLVEVLDTSLRSATDVENALDLPLLAAAPQLTSRQLGSKAGQRLSVAGYVASKPMSAYAESIRTLRGALLLGDAQSPPKVVALTSALPLEGKTFTAISLAAVMRLSGERVLLVDCDLHRHSLASSLGMKADRGLLEVLKGEAELEQAIIRHEPLGFEILPLTNAPAPAEDVLGGDAFHFLLQRLRTEYDHVILDSPPILVVANAAVVAVAADAVVVLLRWGHTPSKAVLSTVARLEQHHARVVGAMFTQVDTSRRASFEGGHPGHYYRGYQGYYQE
jgi:polysaccharide biosynthesis transport protein